MTTILTINQGMPTMAVRGNKEESVTRIIIYDNDRHIKHQAILSDKHKSKLNQLFERSSLKNPKRNILYKFCNNIFS